MTIKALILHLAFALTILAATTLPALADDGSTSNDVYLDGPGATVEVPGGWCNCA